MNLGIYVDSFKDQKLIEDVSKLVKNNINNKTIEDMTIFFNDIGYNRYKINCGCFNSTELWSFSGKLITTSMSCLSTAINVKNNIDIYYYFGLEEKFDIFELIKFSKLVKTISNSDKSNKNFFRLTNKNSLGIANSLEEGLNIVMEQKDEYKSNFGNVYKT